MDLVAVEIRCAPAAFGVGSVAVPVPLSLQGKRQSFEVGASVSYPDGRGRLLRFRDGVALRSNSNFKNAFGTGLLVAGAMTGQIVLTTPATVTLELPDGVAEELPNGPTAEVKTLWKLGDPPIKDGGQR